MVIPKKDNTYWPTKNEMSKITNTLIEVIKEVLDRSDAEYPWVNPTKIGTVPIGFKTENKAANR